MVLAARLLYGFILRALWRDRLRTLLSIAAVALGVAAVVAVQLANRSAVASFQESVEQISGRANLSVDGAAPLPERLLPQIAGALAGRSPGLELSPVIEAVVVEQKSGEALHVLALDLATDQAVRDLRTRENSAIRDVLRLLTDPQSILLGHGFAARHALAPGGSVTLIAGDRPRTFTVRGILSDSGPGSALAGSLAVVDIAAGQLLLGRMGQLDRIDIVAPPDRIADVRARIQPLLPAGARIERPQGRSEQVEKMLRAFRLNLSALSLVSLLVGAFLIYNTVAISVVRRRPEVGALRALGVPGWGVVALFLAEAALLGAAGAAAGIGLGRLLAERARGLVAATVNNLWAPVVPAPMHLDSAVAAWALAAGLGAALLSALAPAREAARVEPAEALRRGAHEHEATLFAGRDALAGAALLGVAFLLALLPPLDSRPLFGYASAVLIVGGFSLLAPLLLGFVSRAASRLFARLGTATGKIAARSIGASLRRASVLAMALATAVGMMASVAIMVGSFRETVDIWAGQTFRADLFVRPGAARRGPAGAALLARETVAAIALTPGVAAVDAFRATEITFRHAPAVLAAGDWDVLRRFGNLMFLDGRPAAAVLQPATGGTSPVVVSEPFSLRHRVRKGDVIQLPTPTGERAFVVRGIYYDYSNDRGTAVMNRTDWMRFGGDEDASSLAVYLRPGEDPEAARAAILRNTAGRSLLITSNRELKANVLRIFDRTFAITWGLEAIAITVAVLGIANALLALVLERRRDIGILNYVGATGAQLRSIVMYEAALLGAVACALGLVLGFALSLVLIYVINRQSFGWTIQFSIPVGFLTVATLGVFAATLLSAIFPARQAANLDPVDSVRIE